MSRFVEYTSEAGTLFLPPDAARTVAGDARLRDGAVLAAFARNPGTASAEECVAVLAAVRRRRAAADALEAEALARLDVVRDGDRYVADEVALELRVSRQQARSRIDRAKALRRLPGVLGLLREGVFEGCTAGRVAEATALVGGTVAGEIDRQLCGKVRQGRVGVLDPEPVVRAARRLVDTLGTATVVQRARRARQARKLELVPGGNGMSTLLARLPADVAASAYSRVDALARTQRNTGDPRTLDQLRADVTAALLLGHDPGAQAPAVAAMVSLHMPVTTALTMTEHGCHLHGYGPIPAAIAREMMSNPASVLRKVITDEQGVVTGIGARGRRPNAALRELIRARDRECVHPGCHRPATRSDLDHHHEHHRGGPTEPANLAARCEHHHYLRDQPGWTVELVPRTRLSIVTTPTGRTYHTPAETILDLTIPIRHPRPRSPLWTPGPSGRRPASQHRAHPDHVIDTFLRRRRTSQRTRRRPARC